MFLFFVSHTFSYRLISIFFYFEVEIVNFLFCFNTKIGRKCHVCLKIDVFSLIYNTFRRQYRLSHAKESRFNVYFLMKSLPISVYFTYRYSQIYTAGKPCFQNTTSTAEVGGKINIPLFEQSVAEISTNC